MDYMSHKTFDIDLVAIRKSKVTLTPDKPAYIGMWSLELSKVLMYEFRYDYIMSQETKCFNTNILSTTAVWKSNCTWKSLFHFLSTSTKECVYWRNKNPAAVFKFPKYSNNFNFYSEALAPSIIFDKKLNLSLIIRLLGLNKL